jgi:hypothetical protein
MNLARTTANIEKGSALPFLILREAFTTRISLHGDFRPWIERHGERHMLYAITTADMEKRSAICLSTPWVTRGIRPLIRTPGQWRGRQAVDCTHAYA